MIIRVVKRYNKNLDSTLTRLEHVADVFVTIFIIGLVSYLGWNATAHDANSVPVVRIEAESIHQGDDGIGYVNFTVSLFDEDRDATKLKVEYSDDGGETYYKAAIYSAHASKGIVSVNNTNDYQIGSSDQIDTTEGLITLDIQWDTKSVENGGGSLDDVLSKVILKVTPNDENDKRFTSKQPVVTPVFVPDSPEIVIDDDDVDNDDSSEDLIEEGDEDEAFDELYSNSSEETLLDEGAVDISVESEGSSTEVEIDQEESDDSTEIDPVVTEPVPEESEAPAQDPEDDVSWIPFISSVSAQEISTDDAIEENEIEEVITDPVEVEALDAVTELVESEGVNASDNEDITEDENSNNEDLGTEESVVEEPLIKVEVSVATGDTESHEGESVISESFYIDNQEPTVTRWGIFDKYNNILYVFFSEAMNNEVTPTKSHLYVQDNEDGFMIKISLEDSLWIDEVTLGVLITEVEFNAIANFHQYLSIRGDESLVDLAGNSVSRSEELLELSIIDREPEEGGIEDEVIEEDVITEEDVVTEEEVEEAEEEDESLDLVIINEIYDGEEKSSTIKEDVVFNYDATHSCSISPFSQQIKVGGSAQYTVNLLHNTPESEFSLSSGDLPDTVSIQFSSESGIGLENVVLTLNIGHEAKSGSYTVVLIHEEMGNKTYCQLNMVVTK